MAFLKFKTQEILFFFKKKDFLLFLFIFVFRIGFFEKKEKKNENV